MRKKQVKLYVTILPILFIFFILVLLALGIYCIKGGSSSASKAPEKELVIPEQIQEATVIPQTPEKEVEEQVDENLLLSEEEPDDLPQGDEVTDGEEDPVKQEEKGEPFTFVDVFGESYETTILPSVPKAAYKKSGFVHDGYKLTYDDEKYTSRLGVDVSHHQGTIDWKKVKEAGYDFAILRIGYRGYGKSGSLNLDKQFDRNIVEAHKAGLDVGVYFFAQAINEEEAAEEARFVLDHLKGYELELPVVYDPESILDDEARTDNVSGEQFTKNTIKFCTMISEAGYEPMVYSNMLWEAFEFDMEQVCQYPFWYADYEKQPQTPYAFTLWQYTNEGRVDGIGSITDINIQLIEK